MLIAQPGQGEVQPGVERLKKCGRDCLGGIRELVSEQGCFQGGFGSDGRACAGVAVFAEPAEQAQGELAGSICWGGLWDGGHRRYC
ncbi:MAG TPA: hypothetical protein VFU02_01755 [Polyangiaceae bacterium]|nr:hypothetical protein [Polyangiaceae bacterium]